MSKNNNKNVTDGLSEEFMLYDWTMQTLTSRKQKMMQSGETLISFFVRKGMPKVCFIGKMDEVFAMILGIVGNFVKISHRMGMPKGTIRRMLTDGVNEVVDVYWKPEAADGTDFSIDFDKLFRQSGMEMADDE